MEERCDGEVALASVVTLRVDESTRTLFDGEEKIPVKSKDIARVVAWICKISSSVKTSIEFVAPSLLSKPSDAIDDDVAEDVSNTCSLHTVSNTAMMDNTTIRREKPSDGVIDDVLWCEFEDEEGSTIRFEVTPEGDLMEICDGVVVLPQLTELVIDRSTRNIFDGSETIPVQENDLDHIVQWLADMNLSRCIVRFKNDDPSQPFDATSSKMDKTTSCSFVDAEGTSLEFIANMSTGV